MDWTHWTAARLDTDRQVDRCGMMQIVRSETQRNLNYFDMFDSVCWQFPLLQAQEALKVAEGNVALAEAHLGIHDIDTQI